MDLKEYAGKKAWLPIRALLHLYSLLILTLPVALSLTPLALSGSQLSRLGAVLVMPAIFVVCFVLVAGALSIPFQRAIVPSKAPRDLSHFVYGPRRLYGLCWNFVYYFGLLYQAALALPVLRWVLLRLFGYRGSSDVTIAPDAWVRDLPVLRFDDGVYLANKCTLGSNICLANGWILVDGITLGAKAMVGHGAVLGPGVSLGAGSEVGVNGMFGIRSRAGAGATIGIRATVSHQVELGDGVVVANGALIGLRCKIAPGIKVPFGAVIPEGAVLAAQADVERYFNAETQLLRQENAAFMAEIAARTGEHDPLRGVST